MYLMYDDDGSFIGIVKENPMAETYHDINWFLVEVPNLIFNDDTWEWEFTAPVKVEKKHDQTWNLLKCLPLSIGLSATVIKKKIWAMIIASMCSIISMYWWRMEEYQNERNYYSGQIL